MSMLSKEERERLRGLSKEHAENIGLHILAAYALEEKDPNWPSPTPSGCSSGVAHRFLP